MALCRFSMGVCIYILLFSLILVKEKYYGTRTRIKHKKNLDCIWFTFCNNRCGAAKPEQEGAFGIIKPHALYHNTFLSMNILNWIFIILTIVKAYYIMWAFMHLEGEKKSLRWSIVAPLVFLILYLCFIILIEGDYVFEVFKTSHYKWIF